MDLIAAATARRGVVDGDVGHKVHGPLPRLVSGSDVIDATASGSHILVVPSAGTYLNLAAVAYNADESGGPYAGCIVGQTCSSTDLSQAGSVVARAANLEVVKIAS